MKRQTRMRAAGVVFLIFYVAVFSAAAWASGDVTLIGEVNGNYQLVSDGRIFEIGDTPEGNELAEKHISAKVKVTGTLDENADVKIITVKKYELMAE